MREEKFKVIQYVRDFINFLECSLDNFPKKDIELKHKIRELSFDILELSYIANTLSSKQQKKETLELMIAKIKIIDFLLNFTYDKAIINSKRYTSFFTKLDMILKYVTGWLNVTESEIKKDEISVEIK